MAGIDTLRASLRTIPHVATNTFIAPKRGIRTFDVIIPRSAMAPCATAVTHSLGGDNVDRFLLRCSNLVEDQLATAVRNIATGMHVDGIGCTAFSLGSAHARISVVPDTFFDALDPDPQVLMTAEDLNYALTRLARKSGIDALLIENSGVVELPPIPTQLDKKSSHDYLIPDSAIDPFLEGVVEDEVVDFEMTEAHLEQSLQDNTKILRRVIKDYAAGNEVREFRWAFAGMRGADGSQSRYVCVPDLYFEMLSKLCGDGFAMSLSMRTAVHDLIVEHAVASLH